MIISYKIIIFPLTPERCISPFRFGGVVGGHPDYASLHARFFPVANDGV
jgi:hypothetical protein